MVDHYECYKAKDLPGTTAFAPRTVTLADPIETKVTRVMKATQFCNPVGKDGSAILDPTAHLECYEIKDAAGQARFTPHNETVDNEFGTQALRLKKSRRICVPTTQDGVTSALHVDRFKCYAAVHPSGTPKFVQVTTTLADEFGTTVVNVHGPESVCTSVDQDGLGVRDPAASLQCYTIRRAPKQPGFVSQRVADRQRVRVGARGRPQTEHGLRPGAARDAAGLRRRLRRSGRAMRRRQHDLGRRLQRHLPARGLRQRRRRRQRAVRRRRGQRHGQLLHDALSDWSIRTATAICSRDDVCPDDADNDSDHDGYCVGPTFHPPAIGGGDPCSRSGGAGDWTKPHS